MRRDRRPRHDQGFTLLEVLVAFVIAALALSALYGGVISGLRSARIAGQYQEAVQRARSHMAVFGREAALTAQDATGDDGGGFRWHVHVAQVATAVQAADAGGLQVGAQTRFGTSLYAVSVTISWDSDGGARAVRLDSERLGSAPPRAP